MGHNSPCEDPQSRKQATPGLIEAFGYIRVSGKGQLSGDGFPRQRAAIQAYAAAYGYCVIR